MAQTYRYPAAASLTITAIGTNGAANPSTSIQIGGKSPSNTLLPLAVDASGQLIIASIAGTSDVNITKVGGVAITQGQKAMAASFPVTLASDQSALAITAAALPLPSGAATESTLATRASEATLTLVATEATLAAMSAKLPATLGAKLIAASMSVNIASDQTVPVSMASVPLPSGAATAATLAAMSAKLPATLGQKAMAASLAVVLASDQASVPVTVSGVATAANQATQITSLSSIDTKTPALGQALAAASVPVVLTAAQLTTLTPLATVATTQSGTWTVQPGNTANTTAWLVTEAPSSSSAVTSVSSSASSVSLLASNSSRKNATFYNDSTQILYLKLGATASSTSYTVQIAANGYYELPVGKIYTGAVDGIWASANGNVRITELS